MKSDSPLVRIARETGVSKNTVSAILRGLPGYAEATRERVRAAADRIGYEPNPLVSALMRGVRHSRPGRAQGNLAYLCDDGPDGAWHSRSYARQLYESAHATAERMGFSMDLMPVDSGEYPLPALDRILRARGITGVIVAPRVRNAPTLQLNWNHYAAVALGFSMPEPLIDRVATYQYKIMGQVFSELHALGYRKIGVCLNPAMDQRFDHAWTAGLASARARYPRLKTTALSNASPPRQAPLQDWLAKARPDVLIDGGMDLHERLEKAGWHVPEAIGYVSLLAPGIEGGPATARRDWKTLGKMAVEHLAALLVRGARGIPEKASTILVEAEWFSGVTVRKQKER